MPENETLEPVASELEQPTGEAITEGTEAGEVGETAPQLGETQSSEQPEELIAGKYKTVDDLVKGYQNATAEASRLAAENAGFKRGVEAARPTKTTPEEKTYSPQELKTWKAGYLTTLADAQAAKRLAMKDGDVAEAQKYDAEAQKAANQLVLIDDELGKLDRQQSARQGRQETASRTVEATSKDILRKYQSQLVEGSDLYNKAAEVWQSFLDMGHPDNAVTQAQAVLHAAELTGAKPTGAADTRKQLTNSIKTALKAGVVAGAGKGQTGKATVDFMTMSDADFVKYKASRGWD